MNNTNLNQKVSLPVQEILKRLRGRPRLLPVLLVLLVLGLCVTSARVLDEPEPQLFGSASTSDFGDYFEAARRLGSGQDPYRLDALLEVQREAAMLSDTSDMSALFALLMKLRGVGTYLYPPFTATLLLPFRGLSYSVAAGIYQFISVLVLVLSGVFLVRRFGSAAHARTEVWIALLLSGLLLYSFLLGNASNGNIGFLLVGLLTVGLVWAFDEARYREFLGGVLLGVATGMKVTPGYLGAVLLAGRRFTGIVGMAVGLGGTLLLSALALGWQENLNHLEQWYALVIESFGRITFVRAWANNQSLSGAVGKLFVPGSDLAQSKYGLPLAIPGISDGPEALRRLGRLVRLSGLVLTAGLLVLALKRAWHSRPKFEGHSLVEDVWLQRFLLLCLVTSLLVSGVSWYHAYSILVIPLAFYWIRVQRKQAPIDKTEIATLAVLGSFGLIHLLFPRSVREGLAMYSVFAWLMCGLAVLLAVGAWGGNVGARPSRS